MKALDLNTKKSDLYKAVLFKKNPLFDLVVKGQGYTDLTFTCIMSEYMYNIQNMKVLGIRTKRVCTGHDVSTNIQHFET
jgi:hypothetical protein